MLPTPVSLVSSSSTSSKYRRHGSHPRRRAIDTLLSRARITNLGLLILSAFTCVSFLYNLSFYLSSPPFDGDGVVVSRSPKANVLLDTISRDVSVRRLSHLIIVPGHAIWKGSDSAKRMDEDEWILEPYQRGGGRVNAFFEHIREGAELALNDDRALLVFSGGQTRPTSPLTESTSYHRLSLASSLLPPTFSRVTTENHALDSYQNLLFSIARFHEFSGRYPEFITVVGYEMKRRRFEEVHRRAVRWPKERFEYVGVDMEGENEVARQGELQNALNPYLIDLYGCHSPLSTKRRFRNPYYRFHSYYTSAPELTDLLEWCPDRGSNNKDGQVFPGPLPWDA